MSSSSLIDVPEADVRWELGGVSQSEVSTELIAYHTRKATRAFLNDLPDDWDSTTVNVDALNDAVAVEAAYRVLTSLDETYHEQSGDINLSDRYNVEARIEKLDERRKEATDLLKEDSDAGGMRAELL